MRLFLVVAENGGKVRWGWENAPHPLQQMEEKSAENKIKGKMVRNAWETEMVANWQNTATPQDHSSMAIFSIQFIGCIQ